MERIPVAGPWVTDKEVAYVADAAANAWYANHATYTTRFEQGFARYIGVEHAVALPSCTAAIHLSLAALGIGAGDEVILPDVTWIATAAPISYVGATPVFVDIDARSWCIDAGAVEAAITPRTKAIIAVDLYGNMPDMDTILAVAGRHGLSVIEDAAEALGSEFRARKAGSFGKTGVFSFHGSKTLTTGEGGMLVTDDTAIYERVLFLRDHGRPPGDRLFFNTEIAFKYRMSALQAAFGLAQLERIEELVARKREIFAWYAARLGTVPGLTLNSEAPTTKQSYWMVTVILDPILGITKHDLMQALDGYQIDSRPFFHPLSSLPAYDNLPQAKLLRSEPPNIGARIADYGVNLPSGFNMDEGKVDYVARAVREILASAALRKQ